uniref:Saposin B-type domain-containing protein n=1 Tax=Strigamia maritima TaxID=126957 RepID=T1INC9_STRMM
MDLITSLVFTIFCLFAASVAQSQQQNQQQVVQPTSDVNADRSTQTFSQPINNYDYTYLTKPYGYSAYRAYDQGYQPPQQQQQQMGYGGGYATGGGHGNYDNNYGMSHHHASSGLFASVWPYILLPFLIFFGLTFFFPLIVHVPNQWGSRETTNEPTDEASFIIQSIIEAVESNKCLQKTACDMGLYARHLKSIKPTVLGYVEKFSPPTLAPYVEVLKEAANTKGEMKDYCDKYICDKMAKPAD